MIVSIRMFLMAVSEFNFAFYPSM